LGGEKVKEKKREWGKGSDEIEGGKGETILRGQRRRSKKDVGAWDRTSGKGKQEKRTDCAQGYELEI